MRKIMIILSLIFILVACTNENIDQEHLAYVENFGWTIKSFISSEQFMNDEIPPEIHEIYKMINITFMEAYIGKELTSTSYKLKERDPEGEHLNVHIYEHEGEIIGATGGMNTYSGMFNLADKSVLVESEEIKKMEKELYEKLND